MREHINRNPDLVEVNVGDRLPTAQSRSKKLEERRQGLEAGEIAPRQLEEFSKILPEDAKAVLSSLKIRGDSFLGRTLTGEDLEKSGQAPKYYSEIGGKRLYLPAEAYRFKNRSCVTVYVESDERNVFIPRTYYLSGSASSWRYLPEYIVNQVDNITFFGKGYDEQSLNAPLAVQKKLAEISAVADAVARPEDADFIFAGTARAMRFRKHDGDSYYQKVESAPVEVPGSFRITEAPEVEDIAKTMYGLSRKIEPEKIAFEHEDDEPDFSRLVDSWKQYSERYGEVRIRIYESKSGQARYSFGTDKAGRSWLVGAETAAEVGSNGLRRKWLNLHDLSTPAFEYDTQTGGYGNDQMRQDDYVDMYANYLSKIPLIQEFEASVKAE